MEEKQEKTIKKILLFKNPFDVLEVSTKDSLETIQKKYKKLSLIIHPDKCKLPKAEDAFAALRKALTTLEDPEAFKAFAAITEQSRDKVREEWYAKGKRRKTDADDEEFEMDVKKLTHKTIIEMEFRAQRAEEMRLANERREKEQKAKELEDRKKELEEEEKWEEGRESRVDAWRKFQTKRKREEPASKPKSSSGSIPPPPAPPPPPKYTLSSNPPSYMIDPPKPAPPPPPKPTSQNKKPKYIGKPIKPPKLKVENH